MFDVPSGNSVSSTGVLEHDTEEEIEYAKRLGAAQVRELDVPVRTIDGKRVIWAPQPGSQTSFMRCPFFEALFHGTRGPGKTDALIMSFAQHTGRGHGAAWRGVLFRKTYPELGDVVAKTQKWFPLMFPSAQFNSSKMTWTFRDGEALLLRHIAKASDYNHYHGHEYPWIGFEELTTWADDTCYKLMFSCCRSSVQGVPRMIRATTNPHGLGHNWVSARFRLAGQWWKSILIRGEKDEDGYIIPSRVSIHGHLSENRILLAADPNYARTIGVAATSPAMKEAWMTGSWDVVSGGMFDDVWDAKINVVDRFEVPRSWRIDRAFDWGSSRPFSVGWYAESDGTNLTFPDGRVVATVRGDLFRIAEWYGWNGQPNTGLRMLAVDVAKGIVERELLWGLRKGPHSPVNRVCPGPADSAIWTTENGISIAYDMMKPVHLNGEVHAGVQWTAADKRPGSRKKGWEMMRKMIGVAAPGDGGVREQPGLFIVGDLNPQFLRTVLSLPRSEKDPDDVSTEAEDHIGDESRYRVSAVGAVFSSGATVGMT